MAHIFCCVKKRACTLSNTQQKKTTDIHQSSVEFSSGYQDSNLGPPAPKAGALTGLRYTPNSGANIKPFFLFSKQKRAIRQNQMAPSYIFERFTPTR